MGVILPSEYQQVEHLESTGTQYIDTGIYTQSEDSLIIKFRFVSGPDDRIFGTYLGAVAVDGYTGLRIWLDRAYQSFGKTVKDGNVHTISCSEIGTWTFDGDVILENKPIIAQSRFTIPLFKMRYSNGTLYGDDEVLQILDFQYFRNGSAICSMTPCYRKSDDKPGMYDLVTDTFFTNQGTGEFLVGPDIHRTVSPRLMDRRRILIAKLTSLFKNIISSETGLVSFNTNFAKPMKVVCEFSPKQEGTGDPSPENIRPISAWDGANIERAAKNLFNITIDQIKEANGNASSWTGNIKTLGNVSFECVVDNNNVVEIRATTTSEGSSNRFLYLPVYSFPAGSFTLNGLPENMIIDEGYMGYNLHGYDTYYLPGNKKYTFNVSHPLKANRRLWITVREGSSKTFVFRPQIRIAADTDETFEPYCGIGLSIPFNNPGTYDFLPIQAGTGDPSPENVRPITPGLTLTRDDNTTLEVWGGSLMVNEDGTGSLVSKYISHTLRDVYVVKSSGTTEPWMYRYAVKWWRTGQGWEQNTDFMSDILRPGNATSNGELSTYDGYIYDDAATDADEVKEKYADAQIVYRMAETFHETYTLSVAETSRAFEALGLGKNLGPLYGGTVTLNEDGSVDVVDNWRKLSLQELSISTPTSTNPPWNHRFDIRHWDNALPGYDHSADRSGTLFDCFKSGDAASDYTYSITGSHIYLYESTVSTAAEFKEKYANNYMCYRVRDELKKTYHFSSIAEFKSFIGPNNVWFDLNGPITVEYYNNKKE